MAEDYYQTLAVDRKANADDIRKAYRRLARKHHPDLNPGDKASEDRFKKVQEAYDILSEPKKRQMYDQFGFYSENGMPGANAGGRPGGPNAGPNMDFGGFDFSDVFARGAAGGRGRPPGSGPGPGADSSANFHDIFSPGDYIAAWITDRGCLWNEQYLLEAFLSYNSEFRIVAALNYLQHRHYEALAAVCASHDRTLEPGSFYLQRS